MKKLMSIAMVALFMAGSAAMACDTCGCQAKKAEKKAECPAKKCDKCTAEKKCEACIKKDEACAQKCAAKKAEEKKAEEASE